MLLPCFFLNKKMRHLGFLVFIKKKEIWLKQWQALKISTPILTIKFLFMSLGIFHKVVKAQGILMTFSYIKIKIKKRNKLKVYWERFDLMRMVTLMGLFQIQICNFMERNLLQEELYQLKKSLITISKIVKRKNKMQLRNSKLAE